MYCFGRGQRDNHWPSISFCGYLENLLTFLHIFSQWMCGKSPLSDWVGPLPLPLPPGYIAKRGLILVLYLVNSKSRGSHAAKKFYVLHPLALIITQYDAHNFRKLFFLILYFPWAPYSFTDMSRPANKSCLSGSLNQSSNIFCESAGFIDIVRDIIPRQIALQFMYVGLFLIK